MKLRLALILALVAATANAVRLALRSPVATDASSVEKPRGASVASASPSSTAVSRTSASAETAKSAPVTWPALHSDDLSTLAANLRAAGLPENIVRALVSAEIDERFRARETALRPTRKTPYWQIDYSSSESLETRLARLDLKREKAKLRQQILGPDPTAPELAAFPVAPEKREQLTMLTEDYAALIQEARGRAGASALASEKKEIDFLEAEQKRELGALLTPQELADFEIARSGAALDLRAQLRYFEATDAEFAVIAAVAKERRADMQSTAPRIPSAEATQQRADTRARQEADLQAVLGERRYAEFQQASDPDYRMLRDLGSRAQIPAESAALALDIRTATLAAATKLADDKAMSVEAKKAAVAELVEATRSQLRGVLGPDVSDGFLRSVENQNYWLGQIARGISPTAIRDGRSTTLRPIYPGASPFLGRP